MTGLLFSILMAPSVLAGSGKIKTEFAMKDNSAFTPAIGDPNTVHGSGTFKLDGKGLDDLAFELKFKAEDLLPNTWYRASITIRDTYNAPSELNTADAMVVVGWTKTNKNGKLSFKGRAPMPNPVSVTPAGSVRWRIDQQITRPGFGETNGGCVDCVLVCAPTTKVKLNATGDGLILDS